MTQIPFIEALSDTIETAIADHIPAAALAGGKGRRRRFLRGRRLVIALVAVLTRGAQRPWQHTCCSRRDPSSQGESLAIREPTPTPPRTSTSRRMDTRPRTRVEECSRPAVRPL
jgi:hypothetical protein